MPATAGWSVRVKKLRGWLTIKAHRRQPFGKKTLGLNSPATPSALMFVPETRPHSDHGEIDLAKVLLTLSRWDLHHINSRSIKTLLFIAMMHVRIAEERVGGHR